MTVHAERSNRPLTVMIWDDDAIACDLVSRKVLSLGYRVIAPRDKSHAFCVVADRLCDAVILTMRPSNHCTLASRIGGLRARSVYHPVILTASPFCTTRRLSEAFRMGATAWLAAPVQFTELERLLKASLRQALIHRSSMRTGQSQRNRHPYRTSRAAA